MNLVRTVFLALSASASLCAQINPTVTSSAGHYSITCTISTLTLAAGSSYTGTVSYTWVSQQTVTANSSSLTVHSPGLFTLSASSGTLVETVTVAVSVNTVLPTVSLIASGTITCNTPTVLMTASTSPGNLTYTWIEPGVGIPCTNYTCIAAIWGVYTVHVKDQVSGCQNTATVNVTEDLVYPIFNAIGDYTVACRDGTVSLEPSLQTPGSNIDYEWKVPLNSVTGTTNEQRLVTSTPGVYTVTATNISNGCSTTTVVVVSACVGMDELVNGSFLTIFPNPVRSLLHLESQDQTQWPMKVFNSFGNEILSLTAPGKIDFTLFAPGIYFLKVRGASESKVFKVIKE